MSWALARLRRWANAAPRRSTSSCGVSLPGKLRAQAPARHLRPGSPAAACASAQQHMQPSTYLAGRLPVQRCTAPGQACRPWRLVCCHHGLRMLRRCKSSAPPSCRMLVPLTLLQTCMKRPSARGSGAGARRAAARLATSGATCLRQTGSATRLRPSSGGGRLGLGEVTARFAQILCRARGVQNVQ